MYNQIAANKQRTVLLFGLILSLVIGLGYLFSQVYDNPLILWFSVGFAVIQSWISYFFSDKVALSMNGARPVKEAEEPIFHHLVETLAMTEGIPKPALYVIEDPAINAFATGRDPQHAAIAVTRGALEKFDKPELEGVLAHELSHVMNRDILVMTTAVTLVGIIAVLADIFLRLSYFGRGSDDNNRGQNPLILIAAILGTLLAPLVGTLIQLAISRRREYLADASGALLTRYPEGLARALEKIKADQHQLRVANSATAHLYIANPFKRGNFLANLLSTHPPLDDRIARLEAMDRA